MKIAMIIPSLQQAGPVNVAFDLVTLLVKHKHDCEVYFFDKKKDHVLEFPCLTRRIKMTSSIDWNNYDVVHSHGIRPDMFVFLHKPWLKSCKTRFITTLHNFVFNDLNNEYGALKGSIYAYIWMLLVKHHDRIVVLSKVAKKYYSKLQNNNKLCVVYNTIF